MVLIILFCLCVCVCVGLGGGLCVCVCRVGVCVCAWYELSCLHGPVVQGKSLLLHSLTTSVYVTVHMLLWLFLHETIQVCVCVCLSLQRGVCVCVCVCVEENRVHKRQTPVVSQLNFSGSPVPWQTVQ